MTKDEKDQLRADVSEFMQSTQPAPEPVPLPAAAQRATMTRAQQEIAFENWVQHIDGKPAHTWTPEEQNAIRVATMRALRTL